MDLSILIVSYNTQKYLERCLESIRNYNGRFRVEAVVVDNNSQDKTVDFIRSAYPGLKFIANAYNYGFSMAMNQAYRISEGAFVMSFNPDAEITAEAIDTALDFLIKNPEVGKLAMAVADSDGLIELPYTCFPAYVRPAIWKILFSRINRRKTSPLTEKQPFEVDWIFGTGIIVRREALKSDKKLYDENSFLFWEEYWLSRKIKNNGYKLYLLPQISVRHHTSVSFKFNAQKLFYARALSAAVGYGVRKDYFSEFNSKLNAMILFLDNVLMWLMVRSKNIFRKEKQPAYYLAIADYQAQAKIYGRLIFGGETFIRSVTSSAIHFLNGGRNPVYPPVIAYTQNIPANE